MNFFFVLIACCSFAYGVVENSVTLLVDQYEKLEALPTDKYSTNQYLEIESALEHVDEKIRIVTYNVLFSKKDDQLAPENRWPARLPRIVELIEEMDPDILCVQEPLTKQVEDLLPQLKAYAFYGLPTGFGEHNGIFYRKERFDLLRKKTWTNPGGLTMVQLKDRTTGKSIAIFNAHLNFFSADQREKEARFIADNIATFSEGMPFLFTGDLNTFPNRLDLEKLPFLDGDYVHRILIQKGMRDAQEVSVLGHLGPLSTFTNAPSSVAPFMGTGTPGVILDYIYVSRKIGVLLHAVQPAQVDGHFPSDHMPVVVDFFIK